MTKKVKSSEEPLNANIANAVLDRARSSSNSGIFSDNFAIADAKINAMDQRLRDLYLRVPAKRQQDAENVLLGVDKNNAESIAYASEYFMRLLDDVDKTAQKNKKHVGTDAYPELSRSPGSTVYEIQQALSQWYYPRLKKNAYDQGTWKEILSHEVKVLGTSNNLVTLSIKDCLDQFVSLGNQHNNASADNKAGMIVVQLFRAIHAVGHAHDNTEEKHEWPACLVQSNFLQIWLNAEAVGRCQADVMRDLKKNNLYPL